MKGMIHTNITTNVTHLPTHTTEAINQKEGATAATIEALTYGITSIVLLIVATCLIAFIRRRKQRLVLRAVDLESQRQEQRGDRNIISRLVSWATGSTEESSEEGAEVEAENVVVQVVDANARLEMGSMMTMGEPIYSTPLVPDPDGAFTTITFTFTPIITSQGVVGNGSRSPMQRSVSATPSSPQAANNMGDFSKRQRASSVCVGLPCNNVPAFVTPGALYGRPIGERLLSAPMPQFLSNNSLASEKTPSFHGDDFCDISSAKDECVPGTVFAIEEPYSKDDN